MAHFDLTGGHSHNMKTSILMAVSFMAHSISMITADEVYTWIYRAIALVVLVFALIINGHKVYNIFKKKQP